jgi:hypothetical protein
MDLSNLFLKMEDGKIPTSQNRRLFKYIVVCLYAKLFYLYQNIHFSKNIYWHKEVITMLSENEG